MIIAKINVNGAIAHTVYRNVIPAGVIGAQVEFEYAEDVWSGLHKTVVFRGPVTKDVVTDANIVTIPPEVVEKPLHSLSVGVYGLDTDGNLAIPTIWADLGIVRESANPSGDTTTDPSLPVWAQIKQIADEAKQQALSVRNDADSGAFDGADGHTPEYGVDYGTPEQISGIAQQAAKLLKPEVNQIKDDISNLRFGDPYDGVDLVAKFEEEIAGYSDPGAWIRSRILANNFGGIHVNDYIPFTTTNGLRFKARVAGIDTYYEYGKPAVGHHIDFICEELWPTLRPINPVNYNNGLIPTENVTSDGSSTQYVLTKPMYGVAKVTLSGTDLTGWTYDKDTYTLTFSIAPSAGTMVVTGTGSEYPWLASDSYLYVNSLAGHVANGTGVNPAIKRVDYTNDGIYHYLPDWLKAVIIEKRFNLNKRYSASGILSDDNSWGRANIGKLWFPTEVEVYGCPVWGSNGGYGLGGSIQYPLFMGNMRRLKKLNGNRYTWWLLSPDTSKSWCGVYDTGVAYFNTVSANWVAAPVCFRIG